MPAQPQTSLEELKVRVIEAARAIRGGGQKATISRVRAWLTERHGGAGDQGTLRGIVHDVVTELDAEEGAGQPAHPRPEALAARWEAEGRAQWRAAAEAAEEAYAQRREQADREVADVEDARRLAEDQLEAEQRRTAEALAALEEGRARIGELERSTEALRAEAAAERGRAEMAEARLEEERRRREAEAARAERAEERAERADGRVDEMTRHIAELAARLPAPREAEPRRQTGKQASA